MSYAQIEDSLRKIPAISDFSAKALLEDLSVVFEERIYLKNDYVIHRNDVGDEMFFINSGILKVMDRHEKKVLNELKEGDIVGEIALLNSSKRICSVIAVTDCVLFLLRKDDFDRILTNFPSIHKKFREEANKRST